MGYAHIWVQVYWGGVASSSLKVGGSSLAYFVVDGASVYMGVAHIYTYGVLVIAALFLLAYHSSVYYFTDEVTICYLV